MKKIIAILMMGIMLLYGCGGNGKPNGLSDEMYESAVYAIKAVDLYLNAESTIDDTKEKLNNILPEYENINEEYQKDSHVWNLINGLSIDTFGVHVGTQDISDLKKSRDELAKEINYK